MTDRERLGALCWVLTAQFFAAQFIAQSAMATYDLALYDISLLGVSGCGVFVEASSGYLDALCSPLHLVFNVGIVLHGLLALGGIWLTHGLWPAGKRIGLALWCLAIGSYGAIIVGFYPLDAALGPHVFGAILALALPGFGLILLGSGVYEERPIFAGLSIALGALVLIGALGHAMGGPFLGRGTLERLAAWPQTIWYVFAGVALLVRAARREAKPAMFGRLA